VTRFRNAFIAGLLLIAPVAITAWILRLIFSFLDHASQPLLKLYIGRDVPGVGLVLTVFVIFAVGYLSSHIVGEAMVNWLEGVISRIPLVSSVYRTVRQVVRGFSNSEGMNFQRTVLVRSEKDDTMRLGFLTGEFTVKNGDGERGMSSVYIPTNHLYLGDVCIFPSSEVLDVNMSLEEGISAVLSCGGSIKGEVVAGQRAGTDGR